MWHMFSTLILAAVLLAGCSDRAADATDLASYCTDRCAWKDRCGKGKAGCSIDCQTEASGYYTNYRAEFFVGASECFRSLACSSNDDTCFAAGVQRVAPAVLDDPAFKQCQSVRATCKSAGKPTFSDDLCATIVVLVSSAQDRVEACYGLPCDQMKSCLLRVTGGGEDVSDPPPTP